MDDLPGRPLHHEHMRLFQFHLKETHNPSTFLFLKGQKITLHGHIGKKVQIVWCNSCADILCGLRRGREGESLNSLEASLLNHFTISTGTYISLSLGQNLQNNYRETVVNGNIRW